MTFLAGLACGAVVGMLVLIVVAIVVTADRDIRRRVEKHW